MLHEWDVRVPTPLAWIIIMLVSLFSILFIGGGYLLLTAGEDWSAFYFMLGITILMTPYLRYLVMADKNYHYRLTTQGVVVTYYDAIPEIAYTIVRGLAWLGVVVCVIAVAVLGPLALAGAGGMALFAVFFTGFKSEVSEYETMFKKDLTYTLYVSIRKKALRFESNPFKISYSDNLYCKPEDFEQVVEMIKDQIRCVEIKNIKGHPAA
jgi:hypothetical protein